MNSTTRLTTSRAWYSVASSGSSTTLAHRPSSRELLSTCAAVSTASSGSAQRAAPVDA